MSNFNKSFIETKEKIVYELAISLDLDPDSLEDLNEPEIDDPRYNLFVALKNNLDILKNIRGF